MTGEIQSEAERRMQKSVEAVTHELAGIRSGKFRKPIDSFRKV